MTAAMRAANKIMDRSESCRRISSDELRDIIDAEFHDLVDALLLVKNWELMNHVTSPEALLIRTAIDTALENHGIQNNSKEKS